ncbi:MAG TPA: chemotaxis protein CheB [Verrucomicrobiae bacterium]
MRKVIVIGGSAGAFQCLCDIFKKMPQGLPAAVLTVLHTSQQSHQLAEVFQKCSAMPVVTPSDAEPIVAGRIYVATGNRHLIIRSHCAVSWMGPRENRHRPSVDALFRTAARAYRSHVIAVILSGALDDGSAGALAVKARGGTVIVQDPREAVVDDMPANVLRQVKTDYCVSSKEIVPLLVKLASTGPALKFRKPTPKQCQILGEAAFGEMEPFGFTCPECGGVVVKIENGRRPQFRCHVGHLFSHDSFTEAHGDALERALWVALRKLNETQALQSGLARDPEISERMKKRHQENADVATNDMRLLHQILARL